MVAAAPLPVALGVLLVALGPFVLARIGRAVGVELAGATTAQGFADTLVAGPVLAAAAAGGALAVSLPGRSALGVQVAAAPVGRVVAVTALMFVPVGMGAVVVLPSLVAGCLGIGAELPGGRAAGAVLAAAIVVAVPAGAVLAEAAIGVTRRRYRRALALLAAGASWAVSGAVVGAIPLGPFATVSGALRGSAAPWRSLLVVLVTGLVLLLAWIWLTATRPAPRAGSGTASYPRVCAGGVAVPSAVTALAARRGEVRFAATAAVGFGVAGVAVAEAAGAPPPAPFLLGTTTALLGSLVCPLAMCGVLGPGRWLWRGGTGDESTVVRAAVLVGLAGAMAPVAAVAAVAAATTGASGTSWGAVGTLTALAIVAAGVALVAGAAVPFGATGAGDQFASFAALVVLALAASLVVGLVAPRLVARGVPDAVVALLVCAAAIVGALHAVRLRLGCVAR